MDNVAWLVPGLADGQRARGSLIGAIISATSPLFCHLAISQAASRTTARR